MLRLEGARFEAVDSLGSADPKSTPARPTAPLSRARSTAGSANGCCRCTSRRRLAPPRTGCIPGRSRSGSRSRRSRRSQGCRWARKAAKRWRSGDRGEVARYHPGSGMVPRNPSGAGRQTPDAAAARRRMADAGPRLRRRATSKKAPARCGCGEVKPGCGKKIRRRRSTSAATCSASHSTRPNNARGYAVGQQGVLLRYGKSWTQEEEQNIPPAARGANFTSIAFAGSEAIVAWRKLSSRDRTATWEA